MYKVAVMGDYDSIYGFGVLGMDTFPVSTAEEGTKTLRTLAKGQYGIIYITENMAALISKEIDKYMEMTMPAIIQIPGVVGNTGEGIKNISRCVETAVGSDILFQSERTTN
ncbi:MAG: V-type ATP synthase subunit F [Lachnospiraceae bacterium]|nr:V-type ATP synthase subunit F [Lachnospiraceae bacterium]